MALEQAARGMDRGQVLDLCDRVLGSPARRSHIFGWLAAEDDGNRWIPVDGYYPSQRLVVQCTNGADDDEQRRAQLVKEHGLAYVTVDPERLGGTEDPGAHLKTLVAQARPPAPVVAPPKSAKQGKARP